MLIFQSISIYYIFNVHAQSIKILAYTQTSDI